MVDKKTVSVGTCPKCGGPAQFIEKDFKVEVRCVRLEQVRHALDCYFHEQDKLRGKQNALEAASIGLELQHISTRLAEIKSQHDPLAKIIDDPDLDMRQKLYAAAHYVVIGRIE